DVPVPPVNANRWAATEVHLSETPGFTPSDATRAAGGRETHFEITSGLSAGTTYYLRAFDVDAKGNKSLASDGVSATAGQLQTADLARHSISQIVVHSFSNQITSNSTSYVTMPNMDQTFEVTEPGTLLIVVVAP